MPKFKVIQRFFYVSIVEAANEEMAICTAQEEPISGCDVIGCD